MNDASKTRDDREYGGRKSGNARSARAASRRYAAAADEETRDYEETTRDDDETQTACIIRSHENHPEAHYATTGEDG